MPHVLKLNTFADIPEAIAKMRIAGAGHRVPLLQALHSGEIGLLELQRSGSTGLFKRWAAAVCRPAIALVGDDVGDGGDTGPGGWSCAPRLARWARRAIIHASGGEPDHYRAAVATARECDRLAFVECGTARLAGWCTLFDRFGVPVLIVQPPARQEHPVPPRAGEVH